MRIKSTRIIQFSTAAGLLCALAFGGEVFAAEKKKEAAPKMAACRTIMAEADCTSRDDCTWRDAVKKGEKVVRRASCAAKPTPKPAKKPKA